MRGDREFVIRLTEAEYTALKTVLGNLSDEEFESAGCIAEHRMLLSDIYNLIPYRDDE